MNARLDRSRLPLPVLTLLLASLAAVLLPHMGRFPWWLDGLVILCGLWRYGIARRGDQLPSRWVLFPLTLAVAAAVYLSYGTVTGRDAGTALLAALTALKLLEMRTRRDVWVTLYLGYFLVITQFLYSQSLWTLAYMLVVVWAMTVLLVAINRPDDDSPLRRGGKTAAVLLAQGLPFMLVLFILFPRVSGPLWGLPKDAYSGRSGLSGSMTPGSISRLTLSDAVAFRVRFHGTAPPHDDLYWRGPVLSLYDGRTWREDKRPRQTAPAHVPLGTAVHYTITLEPNDRHWLFGLDLPDRAPSGGWIGRGYVLRNAHAIREITRYRLSSHLHYYLQRRLSPAERREDLWLPPHRDPQAKALARGWAQSSHSPLQVVARAKEYFRSHDFVYTLTPPRLDGDVVDEFLFDTRRGFCEHYASAFAVLMRAAGIPARVVTGYLGGRMNPIGNYMIVRQADAHAWTEIWLAGRGWVRIDPTGFVAPNRIEEGLAEAVPRGDPIPTFMRANGGLLRSLDLRWDALNNAWNQWVLAYGPDLQQETLGRIGLADPGPRVAALFGAVALILALVAAITLRRHPAAEADPALMAYERFCRKLARKGVARRPHEAPNDFADRVCAEHPAIAREVRRITRLYLLQRYGRTRHPHLLHRLERLTAAFRP